MVTEMLNLMLSTVPYNTDNNCILDTGKGKGNKRGDRGRRLTFNILFFVIWTLYVECGLWEGAVGQGGCVQGDEWSGTGNRTGGLEQRDETRNRTGGLEQRDETRNRTGGLEQRNETRNRTGELEQRDETGNKRRIANCVMSQETEQEDCEERDDTWNGTGSLRRERWYRKQNRRIAKKQNKRFAKREMIQETERRIAKRDDTGNRTGGLRTERWVRKQNRRIANWETLGDTKENRRIPERLPKTENRTGRFLAEIWVRRQETGRGRSEKVRWGFCCIHTWEQNICRKESSGDDIWITNQAIQHMQMTEATRPVSLCMVCVDGGINPPIQTSDLGI